MFCFKETHSLVNATQLNDVATKMSHSLPDRHAPSQDEPTLRHAISHHLPPLSHDRAYQMARIIVDFKLRTP